MSDTVREGKFVYRAAQDINYEPMEGYAYAIVDGNGDKLCDYSVVTDTPPGCYSVKNTVCDAYNLDPNNVYVYESIDPEINAGIFHGRDYVGEFDTVSSTKYVCDITFTDADPKDAPSSISKFLFEGALLCMRNGGKVRSLSWNESIEYMCMKNEKMHVFYSDRFNERIESIQVCEIIKRDWVEVIEVKYE